MKICGLIAEYNPFHNGHRYHLTESKRISGADFTVAVMSGHFLQRGEPALVDKWTRAEMAVRGGVDLVIELPTYFATASAEQFAYGAVNLLAKLGVDSICFGSESGDLAALTKVAELLAKPNDDYKNQLRHFLGTGQAYHSAVAEALRSAYAVDFSFSANNILAIEYLKAAAGLTEPPQMLTIKRQNSDYNNRVMQGAFSSAAAIRQQLIKRNIDWQALKTALPLSSFELLYNNHFYTQLNDFKALINAAIIRAGAKQLRQIRGISEGLENRLIANLSNVISIDDLVALTAAKRYPKTRIGRLLVNILLGITEIEMTKMVSDFDYARILAFNESGRKLLKRIKSQSEITLFTNLGRDLKKYRRRNALLELDIKATGIYSQVNRSIAIQADYRQRPIEVKNGN